MDSHKAISEAARESVDYVLKTYARTPSVEVISSLLTFVSARGCPAFTQDIETMRKSDAP